MINQSERGHVGGVWGWGGGEGDRLNKMIDKQESQKNVS